MANLLRAYRISHPSTKIALKNVDSHLPEPAEESQHLGAKGEGA
jgi:hypothetical protein